MSSKVYFAKTITPEKVVEMYKILGVELPGKVGVKVHSGEDGNQNYLRPEFLKPAVEAVKGTVIECNTAYGGARNRTEKHRALMDKHEWTKYFDVDLLDAEGPDMVLPVKNGYHLKENLVGKDMANYDSVLVLIHFKGHPMGGFGGALKQLSIGFASTAGKCLIHSVGQTDDMKKVWGMTPENNELFLESMADAASTVTEYFKGKIAYVAMLCNLSVDCDCCAPAADPCMADIGIMSSLDPVALDRACMDMVKNSSDPGRDTFLNRVNQLHGEHTISAAAKLGIGSEDYELIEVE